jgi:hypothetical protein
MKTIKAEVGILARGRGSSFQSSQGWTHATQHLGAIGASSSQSPPDYVRLL